MSTRSTASGVPASGAAQDSPEAQRSSLAGTPAGSDTISTSNLAAQQRGAAVSASRNESDAATALPPASTLQDTVVNEEPLDPKQRGKAALKAAQRRFREKQRQYANSLLLQVQEKAAAFEALQRENITLRTRSRVLEQVVVLREEQLALLHKVREACQNVALPPQFFGCTLTHLVSAEDAKLFKGMGKDEVWRHWHPWFVSQHDERARVRALCAARKDFLAEASVYLVRFEASPAPDEGLLQRISASVTKIGYMLRHLITLNPAAVRDLITVNLESGNLETAPESHWHTVIMSLNLTAAQRTDILSVCTLYKGLMSQVYEERRSLMASVSYVASSAAAAPRSMVTDGPSGHHLLHQMELMERMRTNLHKEHCARILLYCFWLGSVMSPIQVAKVAINSYPYFPDTVALASVVELQAVQAVQAMANLQQLHAAAAGSAAPLFTFSA